MSQAGISKKVVWGLATAAAVVLGVWLVKGSSDVGGPTAGTVGVAKRYAAPQISDADVKLDASLQTVQAFLDSEAFGRVMTDPEAIALLGDPAVRAAIGARAANRDTSPSPISNAAISAVIDDPSFVVLVTNPTFESSWVDAAHSVAEAKSAAGATQLASQGAAGLASQGARGSRQPERGRSEREAREPGGCRPCESGCRRPREPERGGPQHQAGKPECGRRWTGRRRPREPERGGPQHQAGKPECGRRCESGRRRPREPERGGPQHQAGKPECGRPGESGCRRPREPERGRPQHQAGKPECSRSCEPGCRSPCESRCGGRQRETRQPECGCPAKPARRQASESAAVAAAKPASEPGSGGPSSPEPRSVDDSFAAGIAIRPGALQGLRAFLRLVVCIG